MDDLENVFLNSSLAIHLTFPSCIVGFFRAFAGWLSGLNTFESRVVMMTTYNSMFYSTEWNMLLLDLFSIWQKHEPKKESERVEKLYNALGLWTQTKCKSQWQKVFVPLNKARLYLVNCYHVCVPIGCLFDCRWKNGMKYYRGNTRVRYCYSIYRGPNSHLKFQIWIALDTKPQTKWQIMLEFLSELTFSHLSDYFLLICLMDTFVMDSWSSHRWQSLTTLKTKFIL